MNHDHRTNRAWGDSLLPQISEDELPAARLVRRSVAVFISATAILIIGAAAAVALIEVNITVDAMGLLEPKRVWSIRSQESGLIKTVLVSGGDAVARGTPLVQLDSLALSITQNQVESRYKLLQVASRKAKAAAPFERRLQQENIAEANSRALIANARLRQQLVDYDFSGDPDSIMNSYLLGDHVGVDLALAEVMAAEAGVRSSVAAEELLALDALSIESHEAELVHLKREIDQLNERLRRLTIVAPASGTILTEDLWLLPGEYVREGETIMELAEPGCWLAVLMMNERDVHRVKIGDRTAVEVAAFAGMRASIIHGHVISVSMHNQNADQASEYAVTSNGYRVLVDLDEDSVIGVGAGRLKKGYTVRGRVITQRGPIAELMWAYVVGRLKK